MTIASIQKLKMEFGENTIFSEISFTANEGDFVGLIGANGTGKTTLFKILTGELEPTDGGVFISSKIKPGYLEQHACAGSVKTVFEEALTVFTDLIETEKELENISNRLNKHEGDNQELILRQSILTEKYQSDDGLTFRNRTRSTLTGLGFSQNDFNLSVQNLSGGQKSKLSMCKLLLSKPDLLLLDEPTNHLDIAGIEWLEDFLSSYKGSAIIISHDRYFLDKVTNKTVEISNGKCHSANVSYSGYQKLKEERLESERRQYKNQLEEIKKIEGIIAQQRQFARERNFITAESKRKMLEKKKAELIEPEKPVSEIRINFETTCETGNDVLFVKGLKKSFGEKLLFESGDMQVFKGEHVFIIGANGCGKTTLLKILTKRITADEGRFTFGSNVKTGYFDQSLESLKGGKTVLDEIWDEHRSFTETKVRNYLSLFLFKGDDVFKNVDDLSGGEKAKLCLLKLMLSGANVLLLDEPTNHLDITSREILEKALSEFNGTMIAVSHDRYFINKLATKIIRIDKNGFEKFDGDYNDYCSIILNEPKTTVKKSAEKQNTYKLRKELESEINKLKGQIKRDEADIDRLDGEIEKINSSLSSQEISADYEKIIELTETADKLSNEQAKIMDNWENNLTILSQLEEKLIGIKK
ncbi:MAG: ABC-F family ATP-binding cassette domain-containing protein [Clostridiales bacterium]|nr:ABC-F family ATP-binding cassette domain-containing protein [Clostridiales bacterium]